METRDPDKPRLILQVDVELLDLGRLTRPQDAATLVEALNRKVNGWANYFCLGPSVKPTERWSNTPADGFASGCVSNTRSGLEGTHGFPRRPCIRSLAWFA
ncbi:MAG: hypothetical protein DMG97_06775 [Acidobacteria bacterium]|nr:MAG: hypothetical protein DMG98_24185 [Acidobacteriota bacterium]PYV74196.1 MAG: hypothetical protein DMG96_20880 [Acidobacteriota bacterium]PYV75254.1 MAG: hypothetical protein DMG97_06775 [Acidobacteriota bacterium]